MDELLEKLEEFHIIITDLSRRTDEFNWVLMGAGTMVGGRPVTQEEYEAAAVRQGVTLNDAERFKDEFVEICRSLAGGRNEDGSISRMAYDILDSDGIVENMVIPAVVIDGWQMEKFSLMEAMKSLVNWEPPIDGVILIGGDLQNFIMGIDDEELEIDGALEAQEEIDTEHIGNTIRTLTNTIEYLRDTVLPLAAGVPGAGAAAGVTGYLHSRRKRSRRKRSGRKRSGRKRSRQSRHKRSRHKRSRHKRSRHKRSKHKKHTYQRNNYEVGRGRTPKGMPPTSYPKGLPHARDAQVGDIGEDGFFTRSYWSRALKQYLETPQGKRWKRIEDDKEYLRTLPMRTAAMRGRMEPPRQRLKRQSSV